MLAVAALGYTFVRTDQFQFWDGLVGNLVATLLGIIAGVPVALHLERRRAPNEAEEERREEIRIKRELLKLLREELQDNSKRLQQRTALTDTIPTEPLKTSIWEALRDSGDLKYVSEPSLISCIANAYRLLVIIYNREENFIQHKFGIGGTVSFVDGESATTKLLSLIFSFHLSAITNTQVALDAIETALNEP